MATGAAEALLCWGGVYEGCISGCDTGIEHRPYHRNCKCALHKPPKVRTGNGSFPSPAKGGNHSLSYPIRRSWSEGCLVLAAASSSSSSSSRCCSPSSSPLAAIQAGRIHLGFCNHEDQEETSKVSTLN